MYVVRDALDNTAVRVFARTRMLQALRFALAMNLKTQAIQRFTVHRHGSSSPKHEGDINGNV